MKTRQQNFSPNIPSSQSNKGQASQSSSSSSSSVKAKLKMHAASNTDLEVGDLSLTLEDTRELQDSILEFPTTGKTVLDTTLKDMLVSLRSTSHADIISLTQQFKSKVVEMSNRFKHIEDKMGEFASIFNYLIDSHNSHEDDITWMKSKIIDLEDRSRRNNIQIRVISESIKQPDFLAYFILM